MISPAWLTGSWRRLNQTGDELFAAIRSELAGTAQPQWEVEPGGLRLEFACTGVGDEPPSPETAVETAQEDRDPADEVSRGDRPRPESQPESRPESLAERVLQQLVDGPMSKADLSGRLGQKQVLGQLNRVIRLLVADGSIGYTIPENPEAGSRCSA